MTALTPIEALNNEAPASARQAARVQPVASASASAARTQAGPGDADGADVNGGQAWAQKIHEAASVADYARANAQITDILAKLSDARAPVAVEDAAHRMNALVRDPIVIVPLPPASQDMIARAVEVARDLAEKAALARNSHGSIASAMVEQVASGQRA